jgi:hypothetical protein
MSKQTADFFRRMADLIEKNEAEPFGGAAVIVPPNDQAAIVQILQLSPEPDGALFWGLIRSKADEAVADLMQQQRTQQSFRR